MAVFKVLLAQSEKKGRERKRERNDKIKCLSIDFRLWKNMEKMA